MVVSSSWDTISDKSYAQLQVVALKQSYMDIYYVSILLLNV